MRGVLLFATLALWLAPLASAHGGDENLDQGIIALSNTQIGVIGALVAFTAAMLASNGLFLSTDFLPGWATALAAYTGTVHVLLGLDDPLLLVGGMSVIGVVITSNWRSEDSALNRWRWLGLSAASFAMFVGYFIANHDLHAMTEDALGITSKIAEIGVLVISIRRFRQQP